MSNRDRFSESVDKTVRLCDELVDQSSSLTRNICLLAGRLDYLNECKRVLLSLKFVDDDDLQKGGDEE